MRSRVLPTVMAFGVALAGAVPVTAQTKQTQPDSRIRVQTRMEQRIVVEEILENVRRAVDRVVGREVSVEVSRAIQEAIRDIRAVPSLAYAAAQAAQFKAEQIDRQTKTLAIGPTGELVLKNVAGDITVKAGSGREATVEIIRTSKGRTDADAKAGLEKVTVEAATRGERGSVIVEYPNESRPPYSVSVTYNVTAPAGTRLEISTIAGAVRVTGINGEISTSGVSGVVELTNCDRVASVQTISGDIILNNVQSQAKLEVSSVGATVKLSNVKTDRLSVTLVGGDVVASGVQSNGAMIHTLSGNLTFSGSVVAKGRYEFQTHSGDVRLGLTGGFDLEARTFSGSVEADAALGMSVSSSRGSGRRSLRGTAGGGGAAVVATTFSGSVWIGRKL